MTKEHLTLYIIDFLENYCKLKDSSEVAALYFPKYLVNLFNQHLELY